MLQPWSEIELKACVEAYMGMLADEEAGRPVTKAAVRRSLVAGPLARRGEASVEFRMQNISAVLQGMNRPWIVGYKPAKNVGPTNRDRIASYIADLDGAAATQANIDSIPEPAVIMDDIVGDADRTLKALSAEEGGRLWKEQRSIERNPTIAGEAKRLNLDRHGIYTCEACGFANGDKALFDAHHPTPLAAGVRVTEASHLEVLCPLCHRRAHRRGSKLLPFSLAELRKWVANDRPFVSEHGSRT